MQYKSSFFLRRLLKKKKKKFKLKLDEVAYWQSIELFK